MAEPQGHRVSAWSGTRICTPCGRQAGRKEDEKTDRNLSWLLPAFKAHVSGRTHHHAYLHRAAPLTGPSHHPPDCFQGHFWAVSKLHPHVTSVEPVYRSHGQHFTEVTCSIYWSFEILKPVSKWRGKGQSGRNNSPEETTADRPRGNEWVAATRQCEHESGRKMSTFTCGWKYQGF